jgi:hypothetical protein
MTGVAAPPGIPQVRAARRLAAPILLALAFLAETAALLLAANRNALQFNPDAVAYLQVARHLAEGRFDLALNGYWGPLLSWLMAPLLALGTDRLVTARIAMALSALVFFAGSLLLLKVMRLPAAAFAGAAVVTGAAAVWWSTESITPDLLAGGLLLAASALTFSPRWSSERTTQVGAGIVWGFAYLAKAVMLPIGAGVILASGLLALAIRDTRRKALPAVVATLGGLVLVAGPWIVALSLKYGRPAFSTAGPIAHALVGPPDVDRRNPLVLGYRTPEDGRIVVSEDPTEIAFRTWSPFESDSYARHQWEVVKSNATTIHSHLKAFDRLHVGRFALLLALALLVTRPSSAVSWRWPLTALPVLFAIVLYLPLWANDARYYYFAFPLALAAALGAAWQAKGISRVVAALLVAGVLLSFALPLRLPLTAAMEGKPYPAMREAREVAARIRANGLAGPVAGSGSVEGAMTGLYIAFFLDRPWVGDQPEIVPDDLVRSDARLFVANRADEASRAAVEAAGFVSADPLLYRGASESEASAVAIYVRKTDDE